jgi:hemerythrin-like domain-containing protein
MAFANRISQIMHDEHDATIALTTRLAQVIAQFPKGSAPNADDPSIAKLLTDLTVGVEREFNRHFDFEEEELFSYLTVYGDEAVGRHLTEEHVVIRRVGKALVKLADESRTVGFDAARWDEFRRLGRELCDLLGGHVQKEEMVLLPAVEETMDADTELRLYERYSATA